MSRRKKTYIESTPELRQKLWDWFTAIDEGDLATAQLFNFDCLAVGEKKDPSTFVRGCRVYSAEGKRKSICLDAAYSPLMHSFLVTSFCGQEHLKSHYSMGVLIRTMGFDMAKLNLGQLIFVPTGRQYLDSTQDNIEVSPLQDDVSRRWVLAAKVSELVNTDSQTMYGIKMDKMGDDRFPFPCNRLCLRNPSVADRDWFMSHGKSNDAVLGLVRMLGDRLTYEGKSELLSLADRIGIPRNGLLAFALRHMSKFHTV